MNLFKFPNSFCQEMDALISKFWWGQKQGENRIHWVSREKLGRSKEDCGIGLRSFTLFNDALLAKQCWRLIVEPNSLWASVLKARYFPNCSFLKAKRGGRASWIWSSLLAGREILRNGAHWQIMDDNDTRVWVDRWLTSLPLGKPLPLGPVQVSKNLKVKSLICQESRGWDIDFLKPFLVDAEFAAILGTITGDPLLKDRLIWLYEKRGSYLVKAGYYWCLTHSSGRIPPPSLATNCPRALWKIIWKLETPPKI
ncbi:hypothetical protein ACFX2H_019691 [Malus domestica]